MTVTADPTINGPERGPRSRPGSGSGPGPSVAAAPPRVAAPTMLLALTLALAHVLACSGTLIVGSTVLNLHTSAIFSCYCRYYYDATSTATTTAMTTMTGGSNLAGPIWQSGEAPNLIQSGN